MKDRDICLGPYLVIAERNGTGNVYEDEEHVHHADTFAKARAWAYAELGEVDPHADDEVAPPAREAQKKPCRKCPFRRAAAAGWLGASTPEGFIGTILVDAEPLPCHSTIKYDQHPDWHERWLAGTYKGAKLCAGALTLAANELKRPRVGPVMEPNVKVVFATFAGFIEHHRGSPVKSWTDPAHGTDEHDGMNEVRKLVRLPVISDFRMKR